MQADGRAATAEERTVLARWSGWGALPGVFDEADGRWAATRAELRALLDQTEWEAASRTTINAHYTSAEVVTALWRAAGDLGFPGGRVLEPGCGSGNFLGFAPPGVEVTGVELDPVTAAIAAALYPSASIRAESFADTVLPAGFFDLVIGNVPFGKIALHDPTHNPAGLSMHNHFIVKSLHLTHPGGLVAVVTSRFTLDARDPSARREIAELADLLGAVRLPAGTFRASSGTDVVVDILMLRRRAGGTPVAGETWDRLAEVATADGDVTVNEYLARHPEQILGTLGADSGQYNQRDITVRPDGPLASRLDEALARIVRHARAGGLTWAPPAAVVAPRAMQRDLLGVTVAAHHREGSIVRSAGGGFARISSGMAQRYDPSPKSDAAELGALVDLRDAMAATLAAQAASRDDAAFADTQRQLNERYDAYRRRFGPLNRFRQVRTGRNDAESGRELLRRVNPRMGGFRHDPDFPSLLALENFDPDLQTATKAAVFTQRVVALRRPPLGAESARDALAISLDTTGRVDLDTVARLLGVTADTARAELGTMVFDDPERAGVLVPAPQYLSGNVRAKLAAAESAAAVERPELAVNVDALRAAQPVDLGPEDIDARLGVPWIDAEEVAVFARVTFGAPSVQVEYSPAGALWAVTAAGWERRNVKMTSTWGTQRADAVTILGQSLAQQPVRVYDHHADGTRTVNAEDTLAAREKQEAIEQRFAAWVWEDPERAGRLVRRYNDLFNATVPTRYDGSHLTCPGLAANFRPHPHQLDAVWRILNEPSVLLGHAVGAGKTASMVIAGMELRRLGLVRRPVYVVPNHMVEQFSRELVQLYPQAAVLVADKDDVGRDQRKAFVAKCATGDWDAVVMSHTSFERIPVSPAAQADFLAEELAEYRSAITASKQHGGLTVKRLETALARLEERHKRLVDTARRDDGVTWEQMGVDYVFYDESHAAKNLAFPSHVQGVGGEGSKRAEDLALKLASLRARHGARVTTHATATPIANTVAEMYVVQRYLQPDALRAAGIESFDGWAATFGRSITTLELAPDGGSYRMATRFARFANVPELVRMFSQVADMRTTAQLGLPTPQLAGGQAETVVVPASDELQDLVETLVKRSEAIRARAVHPKEDNMLAVSNDGRKAALDLRLVGRPPDPDGGKITAAAERIAAIWRANATQAYFGAAGQPEPRRGALQLVFCELGTPQPAGGWSVYQELREQLLARGLPADQVRFIHEAATDRAKAELFEACRSGRVAVLVGSTQKMGVGTNVQRRAVALHHLDAPWRPADIEQREGRILRQGNQNPVVEIYRYVTEGSFDVYMWQALERKAAFIHQVTQGDLASREVDDIGETALSFAEVKALATGNPLILERAGIESEIAKLERLARAHHAEQRSLAARRADNAARAERLDRRAGQCDDAISRRVDTRGDHFAATVNRDRYRSRVDAGVALRAALLALMDTPAPTASVGRVNQRVAVAEVGGLRVDADVTWWPNGQRDVTLRLEDLPVKTIELQRGDVAHADPAGLVARIENRVLRLEETAAGCRAEAVVLRGEADEAAARIGQPFDHQVRLDGLRERLQDIEKLLTPVDGGAGGGEDLPRGGRSERPSAAELEGRYPLPATISTPVVTVRLPARPDTATWESAPAATAHPAAGAATDQTVELAAERATVEKEQAELVAAHSDRQRRLERPRRSAMQQALNVAKKVRHCDAALRRGAASACEDFRWIVIDVTDPEEAAPPRPDRAAQRREQVRSVAPYELRSRHDAAAQLGVALAALVDQTWGNANEMGTQRTAVVGYLHTFRIEADVTVGPGPVAEVSLRVDNLPVQPVVLNGADLSGPATAEAITSLEQRIAAIPELAAGLRAEELVWRDQEKRLAARLAEPFEHQARLDTLARRLRDIDDILQPPSPAGGAEPHEMASIRLLPYRPRPDDPTLVTEYDDCPICLSSDLRSIGDELDRVRCKECGWRGSFPPRRHLRLVPDADKPHELIACYGDALRPNGADDPPVGTDLGTKTAGPTATAGKTTTATDPTGTGQPGTAIQSSTADKALASSTGGTATTVTATATPALPSLHQQHQMHQQLYPAGQLAALPALNPGPAVLPPS